ncbi:MAG TPA: HEAT repeat domain-containing protein [Pyrinomonadaceae bacterium]|nr:HEAT repeat domain-containing protein [Pyrinomonadaceae bacterium]
MKRLLPLILVSLVAVAFAQTAQMRYGRIEFFGYGGFDLDRIRAALPLHEGDAITPSGDAVLGVTNRVKAAIKQATGREPTDVGTLCCDEHGDLTLYIGLPGHSVRNISYNPQPKASLQLPQEALTIYDETMDALTEAVRSHAGEDDSHGYALSTNPTLRSKQLAARSYALRHERLLLRVLESSSNARYRIAAAHLVGYMRQSNEQIKSLVRASHDEDDTVRNNAVRALGVLVRSGLHVAARIPAGQFIEMLNSGSWSDRNKSGGLLELLSQRRDPALLGRLRAEALESLIEMARWRDPGHADSARFMLGRIAGIEETRLQQLVQTGQVEQIISAARGVRWAESSTSVLYKKSIAAVAT